MPAFAACGYRRVVVGDAELAVAAAAGDRAALGQIYERNADALYELCRVILRDRHEASDAMQDTFVVATSRLAGLQDKETLKPWLCAIARHESFRRSSKRTRTSQSHDEIFDVAVADDTADRVFGSEAANLVWTAAQALTDRERLVLQLSVRHGLEGSELADAAGLSAPTASVALGRAKSELAVAVRSTLLLRYGRGGCAELALIAPANHHVFDAPTLKRVARHAPECVNCGPRWNASPDGLGILAVAPVLGAPAALKAKVLNDPRLLSFSRPLGSGSWQRNGYPSLVEKRHRRPILAGIGIAAAMALLVTAFVVAGDGDTQQLVAPNRLQTQTTNGDFTDVTGAPVTYPPGTPVTTPEGSIVTTPEGTVVTVLPGTPVTRSDGSVVTEPPVTHGSTSTSTTTAGGGDPGTTTTRHSGTTTTTRPTTTTTQRLAITAGPASSEVWECAPSPDNNFQPDQTGIGATTTGGPEPDHLYIHINNQVIDMQDPSQTGGPWIGVVGPFGDNGTGQDYTLSGYVSNSTGSGGTKSNTFIVTVHHCT